MALAGRHCSYGCTTGQEQTMPVMEANPDTVPASVHAAPPREQPLVATWSADRYVDRNGKVRLLSEHGNLDAMLNALIED
jgi:hypothetical protein